MAAFKIGDRVKALNDWFTDLGNEGTVVPRPDHYGEDTGEFVQVQWDEDWDYTVPMRLNEIERVDK